MFFILGSDGEFLYPRGTHEGAADWTSEPIPQPCWTPIFIGDRDSKTGEWTGHWEDPGKPENLYSEQELCQQIDAAADNARLMMTGDPLRAFEYERAAVEAQAYKDLGYPANAVPRSVSAWAINGRNAQQAADDILREAKAFNELLYQLREARLSAKERVREAYAQGRPQAAVDMVRGAVAAIQNAFSDVGTGG